jgi:hypothetical protein
MGMGAAGMKFARARTCLVSGKHAPGSEWAKECPLLNAEKRIARAMKSAATRRARRQASDAARRDQGA